MAITTELNRRSISLTGPGYQNQGPSYQNQGVIYQLQGPTTNLYQVQGPNNNYQTQTERQQYLLGRHQQQQQLVHHQQMLQYTTNNNNNNNEEEEQQLTFQQQPQQQLIFQQQLQLQHQPDLITSTAAVYKSNPRVVQQLQAVKRVFNDPSAAMTSQVAEEEVEDNFFTAAVIPQGASFCEKVVQASPVVCVQEGGGRGEGEERDRLRQRALVHSIESNV